MYLSGNPKTNADATRWLRIGIELTVLDIATNRTISQKEGSVKLREPDGAASPFFVTGSL